MQMTPMMSCSQGEAKTDFVPLAGSIGVLLQYSVAANLPPSCPPVRAGDVWLFSNVWHNVCGISGKVNSDFTGQALPRGELAVPDRLLARRSGSVPPAAGESLRICVFGAGATGGYMGVQLARGGADVSLVARGAHLEAIRSHGLRLRIDGEDRVARLPCTDEPVGLGVQDCVIIALKAHAVSGAVDKMLPLLGPETIVVTASNGLPYWFFSQPGETLYGARLRSVDPDGRQWDLLGPDRAVGCVVFPAGEVVAPGG